MLRSNHLPGRAAAGALALFAWLAVAPGCYAPEIENGMLSCGPEASCPEGYVCGLDETCWREAACGTTERDTTNIAERLTGTWSFTSGQLTAACSDNSTDQSNLTTAGPDGGPLQMAVYAVTATQLQVFFYACWWNAVVTGDQAVISPGQSCTTPSSEGDLTWTGEALTLRSTNGRTAEATGQISLAFLDTAVSPPAPTTCNLEFSGELCWSP